MIDAPGLPRSTARVWAVLGILLVAVGISHGILALPVISAIYVFYPGIFGFVIFGFIGHTVFYTVTTLRLFSDNTLDQVQQLFDAMSGILGLVLFILVVYINVIIGISAVLGYLVSTYGYSLIGFTLTLFYASYDISFTIEGRRTPGYLAMYAAIIVFRQLGYLKNVTPDQILMSSARRSL